MRERLKKRWTRRNPRGEGVNFSIETAGHSHCHEIVMNEGSKWMARATRNA